MMSNQAALDFDHLGCPATLYTGWAPYEIVNPSQIIRAHKLTNFLKICDEDVDILSETSKFKNKSTSPTKFNQRRNSIKWTNCQNSKSSINHVMRMSTPFLKQQSSRFGVDNNHHFGYPFLDCLNSERLEVEGTKIMKGRIYPSAAAFNFSQSDDSRRRNANSRLDSVNCSD
ncbi:unnamed protein product [Caenorhabditis nigoni]